MIVSFKTRKLKHSIEKVNLKYKDLPDIDFEAVVYGVTKDEGITITGNVTSADLSEYYVFDEFTFAYNPYRVNIGSIGLSTKGQKGLVSPAYVVFKTKEDIVPEFLFQYLKSDIGIAQINWHGNRGGVRNALRYDALGEIDFPDLTKKEQLLALEKSRLTSQTIQTIFSEIDTQLNNIQLLRQTILQEAVQGKLVPQDPDDEPATELLKKIQAEKEHLVKQGKIKKSKPLPSISEDEIPYDLPKGWVWVKLGEVCHVKLGSTPSRDVQSYWGGNIPWVSSGEVANNFICNTKEHITELGFKSTSLAVLPAGSILVAIIGQGKTMGQTSILKINATTNQNVAGLVIYNKTIDSKYLWYFFLSRYESTRSNAAGGNQPALNGKKISNTSFPLPPVQEQQRIVAKIEQLMQLCDELEAEVQQSKTDAEQLLQAVLREAFEGKSSQTVQTKVMELPRPVIAAEPEVEYEKKSKTANWEFRESVLISVITEKFGSAKYPLGRKRYTKLSYLFHRHIEDEAVKQYLRKAAGPYNPSTKYKGPEKIAKENKYILVHKNDKYEGFIVGPEIEAAKKFYAKYWDTTAIGWLEQFRYKTNDDLELYTTVDNALMELHSSDAAINVENIKGIIKKEPEWEAKLKKPIFSDNNIQAAIPFLSNLFSYNH